MKQIESLKRNETVTLNRDCSPMSGVKFFTGDTFKFLGWYGGVGNLARLSRTGDNAKLIVLPADIGFGFAPVAATVAPVAENRDTLYDAPHTDESGASRRIVIASYLAGKFSGETSMHMTPGEEREYNRGMSMMAEWETTGRFETLEANASHNG